MKFNLMHVAGFEQAMIGTQLSFGKRNFDDCVLQPNESESYFATAKKLAHMDGGHNKFLEQIQYWIAVDAPLKWWKQFDTYRVGTSKSSESTMHTITKRELVRADFENPELIFQQTLDMLNSAIREYNSPIVSKERKPILFKIITDNLPDGFCQTRVVNTNAKVLRNIYFQRRAHKLGEWRECCDFLKTLPYAELFTAGDDND